MIDGAVVSNLLRSTAPSWVVPAENAEAVDFVCEARLTLRDGSISAYLLPVRIEADPHVVHVEEVEPRRLPAYCPDRHVWGDGGFCLGLPGNYPARPTTREEAAAWWETLRGFLLLQDDVAYTRRWPPSCAWPHSPIEIQAEALIAEYARIFGISASILARWSGATVSTRESGHARIAGRRSRCPCGSGRQVRFCHEQVLVDVARARALRDQTRALFWKTQEGRACCGTLEVCALRCGSTKEAT